MARREVSRYMSVFITLALITLGITVMALNNMSGVSAQSNDINAIKVVAVGDSNTYGYGVLMDGRAKNSYPGQLQSLLGNKYQVQNFGLNGATVTHDADRSYIKQKAYKMSRAANPDIVLIMLGTNDSKPMNWNRADFKKDLATLVGAYKTLPSKPRVYLLTAPYAYSDAIKPGDIDGPTVTNEVVPIIKQTAAATDTPLVDVYEATKDHSSLFPDGVHPNAAGYKIIADTVYEAIMQYRLTPLTTEVVLH